MNVTTPEVRCSPYLPGPCLSGVRKPTVLLPEAELCLPLRDVLIHELAHLRRNDCLWNLLRQLATAVFFFQPLLWVLSRRVEATAEEVCDDFVVQLGGDREGYAHRLVDIAELSSAPIAAAGVGIVSLRSMLAKRVARITDTSRSLSTRVGNLLLLTVLVGGLVGVSATGLIGLAPTPSQAEISEDRSADATAIAENRSEGPPASDDLVTVRGQVLKPNGEPAGPVDVVVLRWFWNYGDKKPLGAAKADQEGRFEVSYRKSQFAENAGRADQWRETYITAFAEGYGPGWAHYDRLKPDERATIRLVADDVPIEGRVIDLEGNPVVGASVEVGSIYTPKADTLDEYIEAIKASQAISTAYEKMDGGLPPHKANHWPTVTTDSEGRFRITGIGHERVVSLEVSGPTIVTRTLRVATRPMEPIVHPAYAYREADSDTQFGSRFEYTAAPSRSIAGVIRDADTGQPIAGAEVWSWKFAGDNISGITSVKSTSDKDGRYRLEGMPKGEGNEIVVVPTGLPYFTAEFAVPAPPGFEPVDLDLELHRGQWITGRVTDKSTGLPVAAHMHYMAFPDNKLAQDLPEFEHGAHCSNVQDRYRTDADGRYRVVGLPGHGVVGVKAILYPYPGGQGYADLPDADNRDAFMRLNGPINPSPKWPTAMKEVWLTADADKTALDFSLDSGDSVTLRAVDPSGRPLTGVDVVGVTEIYGSQRRMESADFDLLCFRPGEKRTVLLSHSERRLGKALRVATDKNQGDSQEVKLEPMATVVGRLTRDGTPVSGVSIRIDVKGDSGYGRNLGSTATDHEGRFRHEEFLPGLDYSIQAQGRGLGFTSVAKELTVSAGETIDLGTIDVDSDDRPTPVRTKPTSAAADEQAVGSSVVTIRGKVLDPTGGPVAGATVEAQTWIRDPDAPLSPLAKTESGADGRFKLTYPKNSDVAVVAGRAGFGPGFEVVPDDKPVPDSLTLRLVRDDVPIHGKVIDLEGNPLPDVTVTVCNVAATADESLDSWLSAIEGREWFWTAIEKHFKRRTRLTPPHTTAKLTTDAKGEFAITGIGRERKVRIALEGPTIAYTLETIVTRDMKPVVADDPEWSDKQTIYGANCEILAAPTQPVEGVVRDAESGDPLSGVSIAPYWMIRRSFPGENRLRAVSDSEGRFRLVGMPKGSRKLLKILPSDDQPYLMRDYSVPEQPGIEPINVTLDLHRGVWITGRVTDKITGEPTGGSRTAWVQYYPYLSNPYANALPEFADGPQDGWQNRYKIAPDGAFRLVGLPGKAIVGAQLWRGPYPNGQGSELIEGATKAGNFLTYGLGSPPSRLNPTIMREVDIPENATEFVVNFEVDRGRSVRVSLADEQGNPIDGVHTAGLVHRSGWTQPEGALLEVSRLGATEQRTLLIYHPERRIGKVLQISAADSPNELVAELEPCTTIRGQIVDGPDSPLPGAQIRFEPLPGGDYSPELVQITTDKQGRFEQTGVLPGTSYNVYSESAQLGFKILARDLKVSPGEAIDLGVIDVTSDDQAEPVRTTAQAQTGETKQGDSSSSEFAGQVVDPDGNPAAGAELYLVFHIPEAGGLLTPSWKPLATTDAEGQFRFTVTPGDFGSYATAREFGFGQLVAKHNDFGFAWAAAGLFETSGQTLRKAQERLKTAPPTAAEWIKMLLAAKGQPLRLQAESEPIRGRIVDVNGQPVADARLTLLETWTGIDGALDAWRKAAGEPNADYYSARMQTPRSMNGPQLRSIISPATTDANGRFQIKGVGDGKIAWLLLEGPGIESAKIWARTEAGEAVRLMRERRSPDLGFYTYHPAEFTHVAGPSVPITGVVRDADTKEPLVGVTVKSQKRHGEPIHGWGQDFVRAVTDKEGRYRLEGMPVGRENEIAAIAPGGDIAYFSAEKSAPTDLGQASTVDFDLHRGVWVEGSVTDKQTGEGLPGRLAYYVDADSPAHQAARSLGVDERDRLRSDSEGRFRIAALPGPGYITFNADNHQIYPRANRILKSDGSFAPAERMIKTNPSYLMPGNTHLVAEIDPGEEVERVELNLQLDRGTTAIGRVVGPGGEPVTDYYHTGQLAGFTGSWDHSIGDKFELVGYDPKQPRHVYFVHQERRLAGHAVVQGVLPEDLVIELQPAGRASGRLVDKDGAPLPNCQLVPSTPAIVTFEDLAQKPDTPPLPHNVAHSSSARYETDADGRFEISGLAPGVEYRLMAFDRDSMMTRRRAPTVPGPLDTVITVEPGESKDLGDVRLRDEGEVVKQNTAAEPASTPNASESMPPIPAAQPAAGKTFTGAVTLPNGSPASGAHVAIVALRIAGTQQTRGEVLGQGTVGVDGKYNLTVPDDVTSKTHGYANLLVRADGAGIAWRELNLDEAEKFDIQLVAEQPIVGQLVDIEGQPASGVKLVVQSVVERTQDQQPMRNGAGYREDSPPAAWLQGAVSDADGRFRLLGVPADCGVIAIVTPDDRFGRQHLALNTGRPEQRGERDATYRAFTRNSQFGEELVLPLSPAQVFVGTITYEDTGEPAPRARVSIWASQQEMGGSMYSVEGVANERGEYRISPSQGVRFGVNAFPPGGVPYLVRQTPLSEALSWHEGDAERRVDMTLPRGVLIRGVVTEAGSGAPVEGAVVQYAPESSNNPNTSDDILTGWQATQVSDEEGRFAIAVLPGPGRLLIQEESGRFVTQTVTEREISRNETGGRRNYLQAAVRIDPQPNAEPLDVSVELERCAPVTGRIVDEQGLSIDDALVVSQHNRMPRSLNWRGQVLPTLGGRFEVSGLKAGEEMPVHVLDPKRRLGATVLVEGGGDATVVLRPCGEASARVVDQHGEPREGVELTPHLVVSPGAPRYDFEAARRGDTLADSDSVANIDRQNYWPGPKTDDQGRITLPALIPGALYRIINFVDGQPKAAAEFKVEPGERIELGDIALNFAD
ncbi:Regulatory protein BlaR1 [Posidoniimonas corsicana]|uniref:Regulatory protein BlaR1 n=2 Tax=Posidoniimonas corsicana TaxID=1938618 RepID=A0A5C5VBH3_9BACT|nr:Regulatory protein BlaR1 [Posidoniimonas corsicana]